MLCVIVIVPNLIQLTRLMINQSKGHYVDLDILELTMLTVRISYKISIMKDYGFFFFFFFFFFA